MANQVNQNNKNQRVNKGSYTWYRKEVKDYNNALWPFEFVRQPGNVKCRSISALDDSFKDTPYNLNDSESGYGRYEFLSYYLLKIKDKLPKITHLAIGYSCIYYLLEGETEPKGMVYRTQLCNIDKVANGVDYTNGITKKKISMLFDNYKMSKNVGVAYELQNTVEYYINVRKNMKTLGSEKPMIDIFTNPDITLPSLKYFVFLENTDANAYDYRNYVLAKLGFDSQKLQSIQTELNSFIEFVRYLNDGGKYKKLKRVFSMPDNLLFTMNTSTVDLKMVKELFKSISNPSYKEYLQYSAPLTEEETETIDRNIKELSNLKDNPQVSEKKNAFEHEYNQIYNLLKKMAVVLSENDYCYQSASNVEKDVWAKYLSSSSGIKEMMQSEYDYKRNNMVINADEIYNIMAVLGLHNATETNTDAREIINAVVEILPTYFKDSRKTVNSMGIGFENIDKATKSVEVIKKLKRQLLDAFEVFVGCQYGILAIYMSRFMNVFDKVQAIGLATNLMPSIKSDSRKLCCSKNILSVAERCLYKKLGFSLNKSDSNFYGSEEAKSKLGKYESFCKAVIDVVNGADTPLLTHTDESGSPKPDVKVSNLMAQYDCISFIIEQYKTYFKI